MMMMMMMMMTMITYVLAVDPARVWKVDSGVDLQVEALLVEGAGWYGHHHHDHWWLGGKIVIMILIRVGNVIIFMTMTRVAWVARSARVSQRLTIFDEGQDKFLNIGV